MLDKTITTDFTPAKLKEVVEPLMTEKDYGLLGQKVTEKYEAVEQGALIERHYQSLYFVKSKTGQEVVPVKPALVSDPDQVAQTPRMLTGYVLELLTYVEQALTSMKDLEKQQHDGHWAHRQALVPLEKWKKLMESSPSTHPSQQSQHILPAKSRLNSQDLLASVEMLKQLGQLETYQYAADPRHSGVMHMLSRV